MSERVEVYYNLTKKCWSVRSCKTGKVIKHMDSLRMKDCKFVVQPAGRERTRKERKKYVHAFVRGYLCEKPLDLSRGITRVHYNPFEFDTFVQTWNANKPIHEADLVVLTDRKEVFAA